MATILGMEPNNMRRVKIEIDSDVKTLAIFSEDPAQDSEERDIRVRLYRWLWAAKVFKTLALARSAVEQGRVLFEHEATSPGREVVLGATIQILHGKSVRNMVVKSLSTKRSSDPSHMFDEIQQPDDQTHYLDLNNPAAKPFRQDLNASRPHKKPVRFLRRNTNYGSYNK